MHAWKITIPKNMGRPGYEAIHCQHLYRGGEFCSRHSMWLQLVYNYGTVLSGSSFCLPVHNCCFKWMCYGDISSSKQPTVTLAQLTFHIGSTVYMLKCHLNEYLSCNLFTALIQLHVCTWCNNVGLWELHFCGGAQGPSGDYNRRHHPDPLQCRWDLATTFFPTSRVSKSV